MKQTAVQTRGNYIKKRNVAVLNDFRQLFKKGLRLDVIYERLANKYFLATGTIQKIVNKEANAFNTDKAPP